MGLLDKMFSKKVDGRSTKPVPAEETSKKRSGTKSKISTHRASSSIFGSLKKIQGDTAAASSKAGVVSEQEDDDVEKSQGSAASKDDPKLKERRPWSFGISPKSTKKITIKPIDAVPKSVESKIKRPSSLLFRPKVTSTRGQNTKLEGDDLSRTSSVTNLEAEQRSTKGAKPRKSSSREKIDKIGDGKRKGLGKNNNKLESTAETPYLSLESAVEEDIVLLKRQLQEMAQEKTNLALQLGEKNGQVNFLQKENYKLKSLQEECSLQLEKLTEDNTALRNRLRDVAHSPLSDNEKQQLLFESHRHHNSAPASIATNVLDDGNGGDTACTTPDWDKHSSGNISEVSVACLQDKINQMQETHYSTNEELQATLQELTDLQMQLTELRQENERLNDEKSLMFDSLCRQTERLNDSRGEVESLKQHLYQEKDHEEFEVAAEREQHLLAALRALQEERDAAAAAAEHARDVATHCERRLEQARERVRTLEGAVEAGQGDRRLVERELAEARDRACAKHIEVQRLTDLLDNARTKIVELEQDRTLIDKSELDELLDNARKEKDSLESEVAHLKEQLAIGKNEIEKLKEQVSVLQEECKVTRNNAKSTQSDLEYKCEKLLKEKNALSDQLQEFQDAVNELQAQSQCQQEEKRQLSAVLSETQRSLSEAERRNSSLERDLAEMKKARDDENAEWEKFQNDLLTSVRVANDFKTEAQQDLQRLILENKSCRERERQLKAEIEKLKGGAAGAEMDAFLKRPSKKKVKPRLKTDQRQKRLKTLSAGEETLLNSLRSYSVPESDLTEEEKVIEKLKVIFQDEDLRVKPVAPKPKHQLAISKPLLDSVLANAHLARIVNDARIRRVDDEDARPLYRTPEVEDLTSEDVKLRRRYSEGRETKNGSIGGKSKKSKSCEDISFSFEESSSESFSSAEFDVDTGLTGPFRNAQLEDSGEPVSAKGKDNKVVFKIDLLQEKIRKESGREQKSSYPTTYTVTLVTDTGPQVKIAKETNKLDESSGIVGKTLSSDVTVARDKYDSLTYNATINKRYKDCLDHHETVEGQPEDLIWGASKEIPFSNEKDSDFGVTLQDAEILSRVSVGPVDKNYKIDSMKEQIEKIFSTRVKQSDTTVTVLTDEIEESPKIVEEQIPSADTVAKDTFDSLTYNATINKHYKERQETNNDQPDSLTFNETLSINLKDDHSGVSEENQFQTLEPKKGPDLEVTLQDIEEVLDVEEKPPEIPSVYDYQAILKENKYGVTVPLNHRLSYNDVVKQIKEKYVRNEAEDEPPAVQEESESEEDESGNTCFEDFFKPTSVDSGEMRKSYIDSIDEEMEDILSKYLHTRISGIIKESELKNDSFSQKDSLLLKPKQDPKITAKEETLSSRRNKEVSSVEEKEATNSSMHGEPGFEMNVEEADFVAATRKQRNEVSPVPEPRPIVEFKETYTAKEGQPSEEIVENTSNNYAGIGDGIIVEEAILVETAKSSSEARPIPQPRVVGVPINPVMVKPIEVSKSPEIPVLPMISLRDNCVTKEDRPPEQILDEQVLLNISEKVNLVESAKSSRHEASLISKAIGVIELSELPIGPKIIFANEDVPTEEIVNEDVSTDRKPDGGGIEENKSKFFAMAVDAMIAEEANLVESAMPIPKPRVVEVIGRGNEISALPVLSELSFQNTGDVGDANLTEEIKETDVPKVSVTITNSEPKARNVSIESSIVDEDVKKRLEVTPIPKPRLVYQPIEATEEVNAISSDAEEKVKEVSVIEKIVNQNAPTIRYASPSDYDAVGKNKSEEDSECFEGENPTTVGEQSLTVEEVKLVEKAKKQRCARPLSDVNEDDLAFIKRMSLNYLTQDSSEISEKNIDDLDFIISKEDVEKLKSDTSVAASDTVVDGFETSIKQSLIDSCVEKNFDVTKKDENVSNTIKLAGDDVTSSTITIDSSNSTNNEATDLGSTEISKTVISDFIPSIPNAPPPPIPRILEINDSIEDKNCSTKDKPKIFSYNKPEIPDDLDTLLNRMSATTKYRATGRRNRLSNTEHVAPECLSKSSTATKDSSLIIDNVSVKKVPIGLSKFVEVDGESFKKEVISVKESQTSDDLDFILNRMVNTTGGKNKMSNEEQLVPDLSKSTISTVDGSHNVDDESVKKVPIENEEILNESGNPDALDTALNRKVAAIKPVENSSSKSVVEAVNKAVINPPMKSLNNTDVVDKNDKLEISSLNETKSLRMVASEEPKTAERKNAEQSIPKNLSTSEETTKLKIPFGRTSTENKSEGFARARVKTTGLEEVVLRLASRSTTTKTESRKTRPLSGTKTVKSFAQHFENLSQKRHSVSQTRTDENRVAGKAVTTTDSCQVKDDSIAIGTKTENDKLLCVNENVAEKLQLNRHPVSRSRRNENQVVQKTVTPADSCQVKDDSIAIGTKPENDKLLCVNENVAEKLQLNRHPVSRSRRNENQVVQKTVTPADSCQVKDDSIAIGTKPENDKLLCVNENIAEKLQPNRHPVSRWRRNENQVVEKTVTTTDSCQVKDDSIAIGTMTENDKLLCVNDHDHLTIVGSAFEEGPGLVEVPPSDEPDVKMEVPKVRQEEEEGKAEEKGNALVLGETVSDSAETKTVVGTEKVLMDSDDQACGVSQAKPSTSSIEISEKFEKLDLTTRCPSDSIDVEEISDLNLFDMDQTNEDEDDSYLDLFKSPEEKIFEAFSKKRKVKKGYLRVAYLGEISDDEEDEDVSAGVDFVPLDEATKPVFAKASETSSFSNAKKIFEDLLAKAECDAGVSKKESGERLGGKGVASKKSE